MSLPFSLPAPTFLPVLIIVGFIIFFLLIKLVEKLAFLIMMVTIELGFAGILYYFYLPNIISGEIYRSLGIWILYPFVFWDKTLGLLIGGDTSLILSCLVALGLLWFYIAWVLRKKLGLLAPVISGVSLIILGAGLPGFRAFIDSLGISLLFYGTVSLISLGLIGWKLLGERKKK